MKGWLLNGEELQGIPEDAEGFIYKITFSNGDYYIGKKQFWSYRTMKVPEKTRKKRVVKESDWKTYASSSAIVKERVKLGERHVKEIIHLCSSKACLMYYEVLEQFKHDVLCDPKALNANIFTRIFRCVKPMEYKQMEDN